MALIIDILDCLHERKIERLGRACADAMRNKDAETARRVWDEYKAAILARSPAQIAKMEAAATDRCRVSA